MDLPTYTNIWRIEKRLYKLYDLRLPMPLPVVWIGVFVGVLVPWWIFLYLVGLPFEAPWHVVYLVPPGILTWLSTRPVIENKRLTELLQSQLRYMTEPRTWCRMAPLDEPDEITFTARVWRTTPPAPAQARSVKTRSAKARNARAVRRAERSVPVTSTRAPEVDPSRVVRPAVAAAAAAAVPVTDSTVLAPRSSASGAASATATGTSARGAAEERVFYLPEPSVRPGRGAQRSRRAADTDLARERTPRGDADHRESPLGHHVHQEYQEQYGRHPEHEPYGRDESDATAQSAVPAHTAPGTEEDQAVRAAQAAGAAAETQAAAPEQPAVLPPPIGTETLRRLRRLAASAEPRAVSPAGPGEPPEEHRQGDHDQVDQVHGLQGVPVHDGSAHDEPPMEQSPAEQPAMREPVAERHAPEEYAVESSTSGEAALDVPAPGEHVSDAHDQSEQVPGQVAAEQAAEDVGEEAVSEDAASEDAAAQGGLSRHDLDEGAAPEETAPEETAQADHPAQNASSATGVAGRADEEIASGQAGGTETAPSDQTPHGDQAAHGDLTVHGEQAAHGDQAEMRRDEPETRRDDADALEQHRKGRPPRLVRPREPRQAWRTGSDPALAPPTDSPRTGEPAAAHHTPASCPTPTPSAGSSSAPEGGAGHTPGSGVSRVRPPYLSPRTQEEPAEAGRSGSGAGATSKRDVTPDLRPDRGQGAEQQESPSQGASRAASQDHPHAPQSRPYGSTGRPAGPAGVSIRAVPAGPRASGPSGPARPSLPAPGTTAAGTPASGAAAGAEPPRLRRVEAVVGRDTSGGWRRLAQVVVGGSRTDGMEVDEARARIPLTTSRRIMVLGCTGGAGQTTTALMLGHTLARYREDRVLALDANSGEDTLTTRIAAESPETLSSLIEGSDDVTGYLGMRSYTTRCESGLEVVGADSDDRTTQRLAERAFLADWRRTLAALDRHYRLTVIDPAAALAARLLPYADQLVLVAPASEDAPEAVAMTYEWLDGHGCSDLRRRAVMVINGVSRRSLPDVEQAEAVASGRCRAIVRVPWEDELAPGRPGPVDVNHLRTGGRRAYVALAGVIVSGLAAIQAKQEVAR